MTLGVAPGASKATQRMSDDQTTLSEFTDDVGDTTGDGGPTPAENARDIEHLVDVVGDLTDQVGTLTGEFGQQNPAEYSAENIDSDPHGMFQ